MHSVIEREITRVVDTVVKRGRDGTKLGTRFRYRPQSFCLSVLTFCFESNCASACAVGRPKNNRLVFIGKDIYNTSKQEEKKRGEIRIGMSTNLLLPPFSFISHILV